MTDLSYTVRVMREEDIPQALDVWRETELQEGTQCLYSWLKYDPEAFHVAVTDTGEVIGACSAIIHHPELAFVGFYCVREKYRGCGIGIKVWNACMKHIEDVNGCLNAVPGKLELYRDRGGFPIVETDWECVVNETHGDETVNPEALSDVVPKGVDIQPFEDSLLTCVCEYDTTLMSYSRKRFLEMNFKEKDSQTLVALQEDICVGYGTIKLSCQGVGQIGPLYADDPDVAEVLLRRLIMGFPHGRGFSMMTVSTNNRANEFIKKIGCPTTEECPRLYRKKKIDVDINKVFGFLDLNFTPY